MDNLISRCRGWEVSYLFSGSCDTPLKSQIPIWEESLKQEAVWDSKECILHMFLYFKHEKKIISMLKRIGHVEQLEYFPVKKQAYDSFAMKYRHISDLYHRYEHGDINGNGTTECIRNSRTISEDDQYTLLHSDQGYTEFTSIGHVIIPDRSVAERSNGSAEPVANDYVAEERFTGKRIRCDVPISTSTFGDEIDQFISDLHKAKSIYNQIQENDRIIASQEEEIARCMKSNEELDEELQPIAKRMRPICANILDL